MTRVSKPQIEETWLAAIGAEFEQPYMAQLRSFLVARKQAGARIYPPAKQYFNAFNLTPFDKVKVVILGQDPYHGPNQAHGLSFSVPRGIARPPSLHNMFIELANDLGVDTSHWPTDLTAWAHQGVLLLNAVLTVEHQQPGSHANRGWEEFSNQVIRQLASRHSHLVFILWGNYAKQKRCLIQQQGRSHCILDSAHPSPLSAHRGFFGSRPFSRCNEYLVKTGSEPINWSLLDYRKRY